MKYGGSDAEKREEKRHQKLIRFIDLDVIEVGVAHSKLIKA